MSLDDTRKSDEYHRSQSLTGAAERNQAKNEAVRTVMMLRDKNKKWPTRAQVRAAGVADKDWKAYYGTWGEFMRQVHRYGRALDYDFQDDLAGVIASALYRGNNITPIRKLFKPRLQRVEELDSQRAHIKAVIYEVLRGNNVVYGG